MFLLNLVHGALQSELDRFFEIIDKTAAATRMVTKSAFSLARRKLHFGAFSEINRIVVDAFYQNEGVRRWRGWRLLAIDGSTLQLPRTIEIAQWFGVFDPEKESACPMGRVSALYDVLNRVTIDAQLAPYRIGEQELAAFHLRWVEGRDLLLFDRGYPAFWLISLLQQQGIQYCMRINANFNRVVERFVTSDAATAVTALSAGKDARRYCRTHGLSIDPIKVRLIRVELSTGESEILVTSLLDGEQYPTEIFGDLYSKRWGIEEGYKALKCRAELGNFTGKSVHAIMQDFHAKIASTNLTALMSHKADSDSSEKSRRRVNFSYALSRMKDNIVRLLTVTDPRKLFNDLIELFRRTREQVRPHRSVPRLKRVLPKRFLMTYRRCG